MFRLAVNNDSVTESLVNLSAVVGFEAAPLHYTYFPKLWLDILNTPVSISMSSQTKYNSDIIFFQHLDQKYITILTTSNYLIDYVDAILLDERISLTIDVIYNFLVAVFPKVKKILYFPIQSFLVTTEVCT